MRAGAFLIALAALLLATLDFFDHTRPLLQQARVTRAEVRRRLELEIERVGREGSPPSAEEVGEAQQRARNAAAELAVMERELFAGAHRPADFLVPVSTRPRNWSLSAERDEVEQALLQIPAALKAWPDVHFDRLGLVRPNLASPFPSDPSLLADQAARGALLLHLLSVLAALPAVELRDLVLSRNAGQTLRLRLEAVTDLSGAVGLYEQMLGRADAVPPRRLVRAVLTRMPRAEWNTNLAGGADRAGRLDGPPVVLRLELDVAAVAPPAARGKRGN